MPRGEESGADRHGLPRFVLSRRQCEVLACAARGLTRAETALELSIAEETVAVYLARAKRKLGARNTTAAVVEALRRNQIQLREV